MSTTNPPVSRTSFLSRYKDAILFNRNLIISGAGGFFTSAYVSQQYAKYESSDFANSVVALAVEYAVYLPVFATLFYVDNRCRYVNPATGRRDSRKALQDIRKLFAAFSVSEVIFSITRVLAQYGLLQAGSQPYAASMASSLLAWGMFFVAINTMAKLVKLFRRLD
jgi:hypothetical protein